MAQAKQMTNGETKPRRDERAENPQHDHSGWVVCDQYRVNQPHDRKAQRIGRG
jgi:hypothetical protein